MNWLIDNPVLVIWVWALLGAGILVRRLVNAIVTLIDWRTEREFWMAKDVECHVKKTYADRFRKVVAIDGNDEADAVDIS